MTYPLQLKFAGEAVNYLRNADEPRIEASSPGRGSKWSCRCRYRVIHKRGFGATLLPAIGVDCRELM
jgi:hypothetical protein